jgi:hypothetical protein
MAKIITKNSFTSGTSPSGLSAGELAVNVTDKKIFVGNAVETAITLYDGNSIVSSINGTTGANYIVGGRGVTLIKSGNTYYPEIFYNSPGPTGLTFATITKVQTTDKLLIQQAGAGTQMKLIEVSKLINSPVFSDVGTIPSGLGTYDFAFFDGIYEPYKASGTTVRSYLFGDGVVTSVNGATGAITNVAKTNIGQTFISDTPNAFNKLNYFGGDSASIKFLAADVSNSNFWYSELRGNSNATTNTTHTLPATTGTLLNTNFNSYVSSFNGRTGAVQGVSAASAGTGISVSGPTGNVTITNTGVVSFNGLTGIVVVKIEDLDVSISNRSTNYSLVWNNDSELHEYQSVPTLLGNYVRTINGLTGGVTLAAGSNITLTPSGNTITIASSGGGGGGSGFTYASSAPGTPSLGDRWMDSDTGKEYVYVNDGSSSQWVEPVSSNGLVGATYTSSLQLLHFGLTGSFSKLGIGTTAPANTLDVVGGVSATSTSNTLDIIETTDGAGLRIAKATSGGNARIGGIRLGRGANASANTYLENNVGTFNIYNGNGNTGTNLFNIGSSLATFNVSLSGVTFVTDPVRSDAGYAITSNAISAKTGTTYSLLSTDNGKIITMSNASSITLTVPSGLPIGFNATIIQIGAGQVGITSSGVTLNSFESKYNLAGQHAAASIISYTTNVFNVAGGLTG